MADELNLITLRAPNAYFKDWFSTHYLPVVLEFNKPFCEQRLKDLAQAFGVSDAIEHVRELNRILNIAPRLRDHGITEESLPTLAAKAFEDGCHQLNPRPCTQEDLLALYRLAF